MDSCEQRAAEYLDSKRPLPQTEQLALQLKSLLDLGTSTDFGTLSQVPEGDLDDRLRISRERVGVISTPAGPLDVLLDRIERSNNESVWLFSEETLNRVPELYVRTQHLDLADHFPTWMSRVGLLGIPLWRWTLVFLALGGVFALAALLTRLLLWLLKLLFRDRMTHRTGTEVLKVQVPTFGLMIALLERLTADYALTVLGRHRWKLVAALTAMVSGAWLLIRFTDISASFLCHQLTMRKQVEHATLVGVLARLLKILIGLILMICLLTQVGVNVSALVAGLGIGGVALALAAQKTLSDLFGGISVVMRGGCAGRRLLHNCREDGNRGGNWHQLSNTAHARPFSWLNSQCKSSRGSA